MAIRISGTMNQSPTYITVSDFNFVQNFLSDMTLQIFLDSEWGSNQSQFQDKLHAHLKAQPSVTDSSISHTNGLGGYITNQDKALNIGFDLEMISRVNSETAKRICKQESEFKAAPSPASLWAAKEASFKALKGKKQPQVVSEIRIGDWQKHDSHIETCQMQNPKHFGKSVAKGVVISNLGYVFCFFAVLP